MTMKKYVRRAWSGGGKSTEHEPSGKKASTGNGVEHYGDMHAAERHQHKAEPVKAKIIKTDN